MLTDMKSSARCLALNYYQLCEDLQQRNLHDLVQTRVFRALRVPLGLAEVQIYPLENSPLYRVKENGGGAGDSLSHLLLRNAMWTWAFNRQLSTGIRSCRLWKEKQRS